MWELIRLNRRKSFILFIGMGICLMILGYVIGEALAPPNGGLTGLSLALLLWGILSLVAFFQGDNIMLSLAGAKEVKREVHPQLFNVVEEMRIAANLPAMPKVYIVDEAAPNAFATGRRPENCAVAVTAGLLSRLNRDELQGVVAHEVSHILNRDTLLMSFAGVMLGAIVLISQVFLRGTLFGVGSSRRYRSSRSRDGGGQGVLVIVALAFAILAPIMARLLYLAISRKREYLADATAVRLTRYPEGLASALENISKSTEDMRHANKVTAPMYIVNPLKQPGARLSNLTSTHPPIEERIRILRGIAQGAGFNNYQEAYSKVTGSSAALIPAAELKESEAPALREGSTESKSDRKTKQRDLGDMVRAVNKYAFIPCVCGMRIKLPPEYKKDKVKCPRCGRELAVPVAMLAAAGAIASAVDKAKSEQKPKEDQLVYHRHGSGWESFRCTCGHLQQLSPGFTGDHLTCANCGRDIHVD